MRPRYLSRIIHINGEGGGIQDLKITAASQSADKIHHNTLTVLPSSTENNSDGSHEVSLPRTWASTSGEWVRCRIPHWCARKLLWSYHLSVTCPGTCDVQHPRVTHGQTRLASQGLR